MIVVLWTASATIGAVVAAWVLVDASRDLKALDPSITNGRRVLAEGWVRREVVRFGIQAVWAVVGFLALPTASDAVNPLTVLLLGTNLAVMVNTLLDAYERVQIRRIIG